MTQTKRAAADMDQWAWWRAAMGGKLGPIKESEPQSGFYRTRDGYPVAFWMKDNEGHCLRDGKPVAGTDDRLALWVSVAKKPVSRADYDARRETGNWPSEPVATPQRSNAPSDPYEALLAEIEDKQASAAEWLKAHPEAKTQTESDYARNLQAELLALNKRADAMHKTEKQPHLDAGKAVDERFRFREAVDSLAKTLRGVFGRFMAAEEDRQKRAAQAKFEAERKAADAARREIEAARAKQYMDDPIAALTSPEPELPMAPIAPDPVKVKSGGAAGRAAGLKSDWVPTITDQKAVLAHFAEHPDVLAVIEKLVKARTRMDKGATKIPGVTVTEIRVPS